MPIQRIRQSFYLRMVLAFTLFALLVSIFFTLFFIHHQYKLLTHLQIERCWPGSSPEMPLWG